MQLVDAQTGEIQGQADGQALALVDDKFQFTPTGLVIQGEPTFQEWEECGLILAHVQRRVHWWIGDWLNYGERRWGEMYAQALAATDFSYRTLATDKWVASRINSSRRSEKLSWSHHREVASLPPPEQEKWLDKAEEEDLSSRQLREEIKEERGVKHFPECWRYASHHPCAVALVERLQAALQKILDEADGDCDMAVIETVARAGLAAGSE